jgi:protein phosphatase
MTNTQIPSPKTAAKRSSALHIQCTNSGCLYAENAIGKRVCDRCQSPLEYRYLWALGEGVERMKPGTWVGDSTTEQRYVVISPQIWLDTQPTLTPDVPDLPESVSPYLHLYPQRLHVPGVYGFSKLPNGASVLLLNNAPIDPSGKLCPELTAVWSSTAIARQVYWLWQMLQLWTPLWQQGVASSLLVPENLRVEGWRIRLLRLIPDGVVPPRLADLADCWQPWIDLSHTALQDFIQEMRFAESTQADLAAFGITAHTAPDGFVPLTLNAQLNQILLEQTAKLPLKLEIFGATTTGPQREHNEDACFPRSPASDTLLPHVGIICDGIGGHEGGEVASQLALGSLKLQIGALIKEYTHKPELTAPAVIEQQLASMTRVANNLIATRNNAQEREMRQRMGTTLVMAVQLPQAVNGKNAHELYLTNVGDSRAYWITPRYCHPLTVDDDVVTREVSLGRSLYEEAIARPDSGALTQALGTREGELLRPNVRRFVVEEDGLLLLCSDGLSDHDRIEQNWELFSRQVIRGEMSLEQAVQHWIEIADRQNGHDNTSVVMIRCRVSDAPDWFDSEATPTDSGVEAEEILIPGDFAPSSKALLDHEEEIPDASPLAAEPKRSNLGLILTLAAIGTLLGAAGVAWLYLNPLGLRQTEQNLQQSPQPQQLPSFLTNPD